MPSVEPSTVMPFRVTASALTSLLSVFHLFFCVDIFETNWGPWRKAWQPTPVFLPREPHGQRSLVGYSPQGCKESDATEVTQHVHTGLWKLTRLKRSPCELQVLLQGIPVYQILGRSSIFLALIRLQLCISLCHIFQNIKQVFRYSV